MAPYIGIGIGASLSRLGLGSGSAAVGTPTYGAAVSADIGSSGTLSGKTVGFLSYPFWSNPSGTPNFGASNLVNNSNTATTLDLTLSNASGNAGSRSVDDTTDNYEIFARGIQVNMTATTLAIAQIPYAKYDVIVYFDETTISGASQTMDITNGTVTYYAVTRQSGRWGGTFERLVSQLSTERQNSGNYVLFQNETAASLTISATANNNAAFLITGIQIVERTDPF